MLNVSKGYIGEIVCLGLSGWRKGLHVLLLLFQTAVSGDVPTTGDGKKPPCVSSNEKQIAYKIG